MEQLEYAYKILYIVTLSFLACGALTAMIRTITGKLTVDRFIGINMVTTIAVIMICLLSVLLNESYLTDVATIYVLLSFISVMLLSKIYINLYHKRNGDMK